MFAAEIWVAGCPRDRAGAQQDEYERGQQCASSAHEITPRREFPREVSLRGLRSGRQQPPCRELLAQRLLGPRVERSDWPRGPGGADPLQFQRRLDRCRKDACPQPAQEVDQLVLMLARGVEVAALEIVEIGRASCRERV